MQLKEHGVMDQIKISMSCRAELYISPFFLSKYKNLMKI